jgi:hypothetical protein
MQIIITIDSIYQKLKNLQLIYLNLHIIHINYVRDTYQSNSQSSDKY